ncbi:ABC transporter ATP-binding protein/permease [Skermanella mucosa]|uniref:ABC transporter ATP-binding protein n=1 Tax=Skermanella mucosa TaxID=1789672 RepID=UPI00192AA2AE|nr:ABC transporter ATP-binding protein [Skermanella mucosa]UEM22111.1 ABC transporter ATP-binding protein/permease [Skermanella mucosa]
MATLPISPTAPQPSPGATVHRGIRGLYAAFWRHAEGRRPLVVTFLTLLFLAQAVRLAIPYFFGEAVNSLQTAGTQDVTLAGWNMALMFGACVLGWAMHGPGRVLERFMAVRIRERFADALYAKAVALPLRWHERHHSGDTIQRMAKATQALFGFSQNQFIYLQNSVSLVGPLAALCLVSAWTGAAAVLGYAVIFAILVRFDRIMVFLLNEENRFERRYAAELIDCLGNISTVLTLRLQSATRSAVAARLAEVFAPLRRGIVFNEAKWCAIDLLNNGIRCGLVALYAWLAWRSDGVILLGTAVMVHQYSQQIGNVVGSMATNWQDLVRYQADIGSADEILSAESRRSASALPVPADWREVRIEGLTFSHATRHEDRPTLRDVSLVLRRGARIAFIGESGSGKSTLLRVLAGLYEADRVSIAFDGEPRPDLSDLGPVATLVPQDPEIFEGSVVRNITLGIPYPAAEVERACALACLAPVIDRLPMGLDTEITERGLNLSGGQKQRLALARGILASRDSSLIMLDEPTSSMDPTTEARIYDNLLAEFPDACIVSSIHRLHLLTRFDTIVWMADGAVVDLGSLDALLERQPAFRALWDGYAGAQPGSHPADGRPVGHSGLVLAA